MTSNRRAGLFACLVLALGAGCATTPRHQAEPLTKEAVLGSWNLTHVGSQRVRLAMTLEFRPDSIARGSVRCNRWQAPYDVLPHKIVFPDGVIITAAGCHPRFGKDSRGIAERASDTFFHADMMYVSADRQFLHVRGKEVLRFERAGLASLSAATAP